MTAPPTTRRKHLAKRWWSRNGLTIKCTCGTYEPVAGTAREQEDAHRAHRTAMGETVKPRALTKVERLEAEILRLHAQLAEAMAQRDQRYAEVAAALTVTDLDTDSAPSSSDWHSRIGYNDALADVHTAINNAKPATKEGGPVTPKPAPTAEQKLRNLSRDIYEDEPAEGSVEQHVQYLARACRITDANLKAYAREAASEAAGEPQSWSWVDSADYLRRALETADHIAMRAAAIRAALAVRATEEN